MKKYFELLAQRPLFAGIAPQELPQMLDCLGGQVVELPKGDAVFLEGDPAQYVGVVLSGAVQIVR